jgi:hypothetical protein
MIILGSDKEKRKSQWHAVSRLTYPWPPPWLAGQGALAGPTEMSRDRCGCRSSDGEGRKGCGGWWPASPVSQINTGAWSRFHVRLRDDDGTDRSRIRGKGYSEFSKTNLEAYTAVDFDNFQLFD